MIRFGRHPDGTPTFVAESDVEGYYAIGWIHGRYRPLQSRLLSIAGLAKLSSTLWPTAALERIDRASLKLDLRERAVRAEARLSTFARDRLDAYLTGQQKGLTEAGGVLSRLPLSSVLVRTPAPTRTALIAGFMLSGYLGLAESQGRMEMALIGLVASGADPKRLESMFAPHLEGWDVDLIRALVGGGRASAGNARRVASGLAYGLKHDLRLQLAHSAGRSGAGPGSGSAFRRGGVFGGGGLGYGRTGGGSNAWAVGKAMTREGRAILAGDPHLQINQLPSLFLEFAGRVSGDYWMGATIPGLPGIAVGRNRCVAWSGTFAVADNVDHFVEEIEGEAFRARDGTLSPIERRQESLARRCKPPRNFEFKETARGTIDDDEGDKDEGHEDAGARMGAGALALSSRWSGTESPSEAIEAYLRLPLTKTAAEADQVLARAHTLSLHFVLADRDGDVRYRQAGTVPERTLGWSGLFPVGSGDGRGWRSVLTGRDLPRKSGVRGPDARGWVASANEARVTEDGRTLSTLGQPTYRLDRIHAYLASRRDHDVTSMQRLQLDTFSRQSLRLSRFLRACYAETNAPKGPLYQALCSWDGRYDVGSVGAHAFSVLRDRAIESLAWSLGGETFLHLLKTTELPVWWCEALDRALVDPETWRPAAQRAALKQAMDSVRCAVPHPWGQAETVAFSNMLWGALPGGFGANRGPFPLKGSVASVCQGQRLSLPWGDVVVAPAYRFVTDLGNDEAYTALPGGIEASPFAKTYACWLSEYLEGSYHRLIPPED
ncbi:MAG: penicillin acylase family protein [Deltaproteobacteria bacterium]|nr:penicillin acylase family protein [Deltaproteobacteria bacterium]